MGNPKKTRRRWALQLRLNTLQSGYNKERANNKNDDIDIKQSKENDKLQTSGI